jgi:hypothetical protein
MVDRPIIELAGAIEKAAALKMSGEDGLVTQLSQGEQKWIVRGLRILARRQARKAEKGGGQTEGEAREEDY